MLQRIQRELGLHVPPLAVSVKSGEGRKELLKSVHEMLQRWRENHRSETHGD
jgi:hypothetical protein